MPIVFVHGVNNRTEDADYAEGVTRKTEFLRSLFAPQVGLDQQVLISFPYWGGQGVKFRWNQASVPSDSEQIEELTLMSKGVRLDIRDGWLADARSQYGASGVNLGELSRSKGFMTALDLVWDTAATVLNPEKGYRELVESYLASMDYAKSNQVPAWAFQEPPLSNEAFVEKLLAEIAPYRPNANNTKSLESLSISSWYQSLKEAVSRLADLPGDKVTSKVVSLVRKSAHEKASRFIGDVFVYLNSRGTIDKPGKILEDILSKLREAQAAKRNGDDKLIVVGHSLGGVIIYDLLTFFAPDIKVDILVTVGSQVALFEEMALFHTSKQEPPTNPSKDRLESPKNVGKWLNIYDTNDVFSFLANAVFNGVEDYRFDTGYGLLDAHGGYFARPSFYKRLAVNLSKEV